MKPLTKEGLQTTIRVWEFSGNCHLNPRQVLELLEERDALTSQCDDVRAELEKAQREAAALREALAEAIAHAMRHGAGMEAARAVLADTAQAAAEHDARDY